MPRVESQTEPEALAGAILHETFLAAVNNSLYVAAAARIAEKLAEHGVELSEKELESLAEHLKAGETEEFFSILSERLPDTDVAIAFDQNDLNELAETLEKVLGDGPFVERMARRCAKVVLSTLKREWRHEWAQTAREQDGFRRRLKRLWGTPIGRLRLLIVVATEIGNLTAQRAAVSGESPVLYEVLFRLHARACQVANEIVCLMEGGFADGAMARWRTLHEIATVVLLLKEHGEPLALRYLDHDAIEAFRAARDYRECSERLGYEPISDEEFSEVSRAKELLSERYGKSFCSQWGWAAEAVRKEQPTLADLQFAAGIDHMKVHYRMASHNVHANPKGIYLRLGLLDERDLLLAGPSNAGLVEPGQNCAISLAQITTAIGAIDPNFDTVVSAWLLVRLRDEIGRRFEAVHEKQLRESQA